MSKINKNQIINDKQIPLVSIVLPAYNEAAILRQSIDSIITYLQTMSEEFRWEIILVNDGSKDETGKIADALSLQYPIIKVIHHIVNLNLGNALKTGFLHACGDYVITMDLDLSYSVDHIEKLIRTIVATQADMVLASPYMKGGKVTAVPVMRLAMSKWVNWLMSLSSQEKYHTFTCMVRAYKTSFIKTLNLKTKDYEINPEIIYKAMILRARIIEIPAHLDWSFQNKAGESRTSGIKIFKGIFSGMMASFILRPYIYYLLAGGVVLLFALYMIVWLAINTIKAYPLVIAKNEFFDDKFSAAVALVFNTRPHSFFIAGLLLVVAIQFLSIGFLSLQNKRYFEELFHINTTILKKSSAPK